VALVMGSVLGQPLLLSPWAIVAFPAAAFVSTAFAAMTLCMTTALRTFEDFDPVMGLLVMPMFLFSGIFFPIVQFPGPVQWLVAALPLYHAVELLRALTTGAIGPNVLSHVVYLGAAGFAAFVLALHRLERKLVK